MSETSAEAFAALSEAKDVPRPVWATNAPWPVDKIAQAKHRALALLFGQGLNIVRAHGLYIVYTPGEPCHCHTCSQELQHVIDTTPGADTFDGPLNRMILCPDCGNKRCPKANHHDNACTGSNEPGQKGSAYQ